MTGRKNYSYRIHDAELAAYMKWRDHFKDCRQCLSTQIGFGGYPKCKEGERLFQTYRAFVVQNRRE